MAGIKTNEDMINALFTLGPIIEKVWTNEKILSKRAPEWLLSGDAFKWKTKGTFAYDAGTGRDTV